ncbi:MAG: hypothetical protein MUO38_13010 [Anaerolineales bacterium]|nr:hypothetical protein [Anaerolineales bacterium]
MNPRRGGRWWVGAFAIFLALLGVWAIAVWQLYPAGAGPLTLRLGLHSRLQADYGPDQPGLSLAVLRLSIVEDVLRDLGFSGEEAQAQREGVEAAMAAPVPTATARDFEGSAPFTATLVPTATPTETPVPTATPVPTNTRRPTRTPTRTSPPPPPPTSAPTDTAPPPPTSAPTIDDDHDPEINGMQFDPTTPPGPLSSCTIIVTDMWITDGAPSSGIDVSNVVLKYEDPNNEDTYIHFPVTQTEGPGWTADPGSSWHAHYAGTIIIRCVTVPSGSPEGSGPMSATASPSVVIIHVWGKVTDNAGHSDVQGPYEFELTTSCP